MKHLTEPVAPVTLRPETPPFWHQDAARNGMYDTALARDRPGTSGASSAGPCTVVLDQARSVTVRFSRVLTDPTLTPRTSVIRAAHVTELRAAIDTLRSRQGLAAFGGTDASLSVGATTIRQVHLAELRTAVSAVYAARGLSASAWTHATITPGATVVRAVHIGELRGAVLALE